jgi:hypothetical protein
LEANKGEEETRFPKQKPGFKSPGDHNISHLAERLTGKEQTPYRCSLSPPLVAPAEHQGVESAAVEGMINPSTSGNSRAHR